MSSKPWYSWYPADYRAKTGHLDYVHDAAYRRLIDAYMERSGVLPSDRPSLYRIASAMTETEQSAIDRVSNEFFTINDNNLHHCRCDDELQKQAALRERLSQAGKRGGLLAGKGRPISKLGLAQAKPQSQSQSQSQVTTTPTTTESKSKTQHAQGNGKTRKSSLPDYLERLEPSERLKAYCERIGETQIKAHLVYFVGYVKANGKQYVDWDQAVMNAIRSDWAGLRKGQ